MNKKLNQFAYFSDDRIKSSEILKGQFVSVNNINQNKQGIKYSQFIPKGEFGII
ncbi:MAG: hypothetical protein IPO37_00180 [Saprospiraceae bacterium]|nr:hypothetical protein [Saprospiraceae bacterium]